MAKCLINNTGNKGANGVMIQILNFFIGKGYTPTQACAIAGNVFGESSYIPDNKNGAGCIGLFQWCPIGSPSRKDKLIAKYGDPGWKNVDNQLNFVWEELGTTYSNVGDYFKTQTKTLPDYCYYWLRYFETPSIDENELRTKFLPTRLTKAKEAASIYNQMNKGECVVDTSGTSSGGNGGFSCETNEEPTSDISIVPESAVTATTSQSDGNTQTNEKTVDTRPIFAGDSWAYKIYQNSDSMKKNWRLLAKEGRHMENIAKQLKSTLSSDYCKPKFIVVYCGDDTVFTRDSSSIFTTGAKDAVKALCRKILSACNGIDVYFCENVMETARNNAVNCKSNFYYTASAVINKVLAEINSEGYFVNMTVLKMPQDPTLNLVKQYATCAQRPTLKPPGFIALGAHIYRNAK